MKPLIQASAGSTMQHRRLFHPAHSLRWVIWGATILVMLVMPLLFSSGFAMALLSQMGIMIIFALSYNMLLGQTGMLSFGHAVYSGLGAFVAAHVLNMIGAGEFPLPVSLLPIVGGLGGMLFGVLFGYVTTRKSGTTFAMITLGIGEMVAASSLMFPGFFGGEGGVPTNRTVGHAVLGITYGPAIQVYYLIAAWCLVSMIAMYAWTQTPLGRMANAVRDNPERAEFVGYSTQRVRYLVMILSAFFAGIAGGLSVINFEIVTAENVGAAQSGGVLLATFIGGGAFFFGPIIGSILFVLFAVALSNLTHAWLLYLGLFFVLIVMYVPGGVSSLLMKQVPLIAARKLHRMLPSYAVMLGAALIVLSALVLTVELVYKIQIDSDNGTVMALAGLNFDAASWVPWAAAAVLWVVGVLAARVAAARVRSAWDQVQREIAGSSA
ncbi:branched-chain amino acid ABC transporter permease [Paraburkholderia sp. B3]